jgi:hypothetical protein
VIVKKSKKRKKRKRKKLMFSIIRNMKRIKGKKSKKKNDSISFSIFYHLFLSCIYQLFSLTMFLPRRSIAKLRVFTNYYQNIWTLFLLSNICVSIFSPYLFLTNLRNYFSLKNLRSFVCISVYSSKMLIIPQLTL